MTDKKNKFNPPAGDRHLRGKTLIIKLTDGREHRSVLNDKYDGKIEETVMALSNSDRNHKKYISYQTI